MSDKIAVCSRSFSCHQVLTKELKGKFENVRLNSEGKKLEGAELISFLKGYNKAIIGLEVVNEKILADLPELEVISKYGVGLDKIDFRALDKFNIKFGHTPGVNKQSVAELTLSHIISILRGLHTSTCMIREGKWQQIKGPELGSSTLGIIGTGNVGKVVAQLARAFGSKVLVHDIAPDLEFYQANQLIPVSKEALLQQSDIVSLHIPYHEGTHHYIGAFEFNLMKDGSYLVNTARGGLIDESLLKEHLKTKKIAAAACDVFEVEPPSDREILELPNFLYTSHLGGSSEQAILNMGRAAIHGLSDYKDAKEYL